MVQIKLQTDRYEPFFDFLKAYCIICVLLAHCLTGRASWYSLYPIWGSMQVPLFFVIQSFHTLKRDKHVGLQKVIRRIILPFIVTQIFFITVYFLIYNHEFSGAGLVKVIKDGGLGPGSYFVWVYVEFVFVLAAIKPIFRKLSFRRFGICILTITLILEILMNFIQPPDWLYRLLFIRYFLIVLLGGAILENGIVISSKSILCSIVSIFAVVFFYYMDGSLKPIVYSSSRVICTHNWVCYFYAVNVLSFGLWKFYHKYKDKIWLKQILMEIGRSSYEIYLLQMGFFALARPFVNELSGDIWVRGIIISLLCFPSSIILGVCYHKMNTARKSICVQV